MTTQTATKGILPDSSVLSELKTAVQDQPTNIGLKNAVQILGRASPHYSWTGIYLVDGENLALAAYAGEGETEHVRIPIGQGICGLAAKQAETIIVPDVNRDPRYLMCFPSTRSEIVVPIVGSKGVLGEIDIDSDRLSAFSRDDQDLLEKAAHVIASYLENP